MKFTLNFKNILIIFIFFILIIARFLFINTVPPGMAHDEAIYSLTSKSFLLRGVDITGFGLPIAFFKTNTEGNISVLPPLLLAPFYAFFSLTQTNVMILYGVVSLLTAFALYLFAYFLLGNKEIALFSTFLFLINPWAIFLSRFATESPFALLFFLLGMATILRFRGWKLIFPFLFFVFGFFSYHGAKVIYPFVILSFLIYLVREKSKIKLSKKSAFIFIFVSFFIFILFYAISYFIPGSIISQRNDAFFINSKNVTDFVNQSRASVLDNPFSPIFVNKITGFAYLFFERYFTAFSTTVLFLYGDSRLVYSFLSHGLFYYFDFILILAGFIFLWIKHKREALLLTTLLLIAPLPSAINKVELTYVHRSFLMLPILLIFSGTGLYAVFDYFKQKKFGFIAIIIVAAIIAFSAGNFFYFYFFRYPIQSGEFYSLNNRLLAKFIKQSISYGKPIISINEEPGDAYLESVFYLNDKNIFEQMENNINDFNRGNYHFSNISFIGGCPEFHQDTIYIVDYVKPCFPNNQVSYVIINPKDKGIFYKIYNSDLCKNNYLKTDGSLPLLSDYNIEQMNTKTFCNKWVRQL